MNVIIVSRQNKSVNLLIGMKRYIKGQKNEFEQEIGLKFNEESRTVTAFLTNFKSKTYVNIQESEERMALLCYFQDEYGLPFKCYMPFDPYFYVAYEPANETEVRVYIQNKVSKILRIEQVEKMDLEQTNHLSGRMQRYIKLSFRTTLDLTNARKMLDIKKKASNNNLELYIDARKNGPDNPRDMITDIREYDVLYQSRVCIDTGLRAGKWFEVELKEKFITGVKDSPKKSIPDLKVLAFDIETSKDPFKFPEKEKDIIMMISLMYEGEAVLIVNAGFCGQPVDSFQYDPEGKPEYRCHVEVYNTESEKQCLEMFIKVIQAYQPTVITSFNGDKFDYPFIEARCESNFIDFNKKMGVNSRGGEFFGSYISHLDCFYWVERDAYLPQGSRGLKAVTRSKLKYQPIQVNPEDMVPLAKKDTKALAEYSVSDAVATFFLYMKHIHGFIFALSTIIPMMPDEVLRKGSGTLCENLLMAEAYSRNIIFPNKQIENFEKFYRGHLLDTETYTGGKVECLRCGVYRADLKTEFSLDPRAYQQLIDNLDTIIEFTVHHEKQERVQNIKNYEEIKDVLTKNLERLRDVPNPNKHETLPLIYHIDVAAMYPNIIITNRLQPVAVVNDKICSGCLFNSPEYNCKRSLEWEWKGEYFPLNEGEYAYIKEKQALQMEANEGRLDAEKNLKKEVRKYCQQVYRKAHISASQVRRDTVCMRENSFYVDTVRAFRDRRYEYKGLVKQHRKRAEDRALQRDYEQEKEQIKLMQLYESMQLAHKIILNSFYGYVMRRGSRWYSMETAAMVTYIGSNIINDSKNYVDNKLGKPLELDTDGIWMLLPEGFPEDIKIKFENGSSVNMSYPCQLLNYHIYEKYANSQYQNLVNQENFEYDIRKEMTIAFEIDGPYKAMFIPGGKEKKKTQDVDIQQHSNQMLKKRYVVFNFKNQVSEFKGLEMKRRGELNIIKMFQSEIFDQYVKGTTLKECYQFCAQIAMKYLSFILQKGKGRSLDYILERLEESKNLSKDMEEYGEAKGVAINSAKRLAEYLGPEVVKGKNLRCFYIVSAFPTKKSVTERAIPTQIFFADEETQRKYIYSWTQNDSFKSRVDIQDVLDWDYYKERLATQIQKMVCIPAVMQNIANPILDIELPDWLQKKTFDLRHHRQEKIASYGFINLGNDRGNNQYHHTSSKKGHEAVELSDKKKEKKTLLELEKGSGTLFTNMPKNHFSMNTNFKSWLGEQKKIWRENKRHSAAIESSKFFELKSVLQVVPLLSSPGCFTVWYYSGHQIQSLFLNFKRHYFMKDPSGKGTKKAPRDQGSAVEIIVEESEFIKNQDYYDSMLGKTFYQTKMGLLTNLVIKKGNLWRISKQLSIYQEEDVIEEFGSMYLPNIEDNFMPIVYVCRKQVLENRQIFAVICPRLKEYTLIFVDNSQGKNNDELLKQARKIVNRQEVKISVKSKVTEIDACQLINELLIMHHEAMNQIFMIVLQVDCSTSYLQSVGVKTLEEDFPVIRIQPFSVESVSSLDWRQKSMKKLIQESLGVTKHILELLEWSRFTHIPICNLSDHRNNLFDYVTNVTYGRLLHSGDYVTWWDEYSAQILSTYECNSQLGRILHPGLYTSFCIEINVDNLAVNTIANSEELTVEDRDAAMMMQKATKANTSNAQGINKIECLDEMTQAKKAFEYLKKMVKGWIRDLEAINWDKANDLLRNLHKWITTHSNSLYDPLLSRMINELMKKIFSILMRKLTDLGMNIVFANFSKIIVATDKHTYQQAKSAISYILAKCMEENKKLFGYLLLNATDVYYQVLLYQDPFNYVGILVNQDEYETLVRNLSHLSIHNRVNSDSNAVVANNNEIIGENVPKNIEYTFKITKLLNPIAKEEFQHLILEFVGKLCDIQNELVIEYQDNKMKLMLNYDRLLKERMSEYIQTKFQEQLLKSIECATDLWEEQQEMAKDEQATQSEEGSIAEDSENQQEADMDSFIVDDSQELHESKQREDSQRAQYKTGRRKPKRKKQKKLLIDFSRWGSDKQLDIMIRNLFTILNYGGIYEDQLSSLSKKAFQRLNEEAMFENREIKPVYPQFQLPCSSCFLVNQQPGQCENCQEPIGATKELQNAVWKMVQEQGRDLYCNRCQKIMDSYLKKCGCGGKWELHEHPLQWLPYVDRHDQEWEYINKVFDFMGYEM